MAAQINRYRKSKRIIAARDCITRNSTAPQLGDTREQEGSGNCINIRSSPLLPHRPLDLCTLLPYGSRVSVPYIVCACVCACMRARVCVRDAHEVATRSLGDEIRILCSLLKGGLDTYLQYLLPEVCRSWCSILRIMCLFDLVRSLQTRLWPIGGIIMSR